MDNQVTQNRIKSIYRMLLEIVNGNLEYRIQFEEADDQFNDIAKSLNELAEKMQAAAYENPYLSTDKLKPSQTDEPAILIQKVQDYVLNHLEEKLPSTKELSKMFGTNEFTLKENFRNLLKTSIYQFYNDERLKKAHLLIQQTTIPLGNIAVLSGFNNYTNFFKAFKKKYGYTPSGIVKKNTPES